MYFCLTDSLSFLLSSTYICLFNKICQKKLKSNPHLLWESKIKIELKAYKLSAEFESIECVEALKLKSEKKLKSIQHPLYENEYQVKDNLQV